MSSPLPNLSVSSDHQSRSSDPPDPVRSVSGPAPAPPVQITYAATPPPGVVSVSIPHVFRRISALLHKFHAIPVRLPYSDNFHTGFAQVPHDSCTIFMRLLCKFHLTFLYLGMSSARFSNDSREVSRGLSRRWSSVRSLRAAGTRRRRHPSVASPCVSGRHIGR